MNPSTSQSLQQKQKAALLRLLAFNSTTTDSSDQQSSQWVDQWKVLIYDRYCRDVISPVLKLHELRKQGVTLHMLLESERQAIPDVPAIYFVRPTSENVQMIAKDCVNSMYNALHLNFASPLHRNLLEQLARSTVETGSASLISKVYDQHLGFVSYEPNLFTLNHENSYCAYNDPKIQDTQIEATMNSIVDGLFSVLATLGAVPVIRCPNGEGPSKMVAEKLNSMIRDHLVSRSGVFSDNVSGSSFQRPVLIIMDRNEDLASAIHHPSTYQALVDDLLNIKMNRVNVKVTTKSGETAKKTYDLDVTNDAFFGTHAGALFPDAIAANEEEMKEVTKKEEEIRTKAGNPEGEGTKSLVAAVDTLPALMEKKKMLEVHTNIFQGAFEIVASRHVPSYSMLEQKLIDGSHVDRAEVLELLGDTEKGTLADKVRLMIIYYLATGVSSTEMSDMEEVVTRMSETGPTNGELEAWQYIRNHSAFQRHASVGESFAPTTSPPTSSNPSMSMFKDLAGNLAGNLAGHAQGFLQQAASSVRQFLPENKKLHVTRVTDAICEIKPNTEDETYMYLDPKIKATTDDVPRQHSPFREAIVFMIGGGNYNEFQNIQAYAKAQQHRHVIYGCTELTRPEGFLEQLSSLV